MNGFESKSYSINDFLEWHDRKQLKLSPKFQRRSVWKQAAKSFLMDTIIRKKPLPKIFIRQITEVETRTTIREVVDGQQRLRAIIEYLNDGYKISLNHNSEYGDVYFSNLPPDIQSIILTYEISVDVLLGVDDSDILDIFARLNAYSVTLNKQEILNAEFYGYFKQLVYDIAFTFNNFWISNKIFTDYKIMRMAEVELVTDIIIGMIDGIQHRKEASKYYAKYDETFIERNEYRNRFNKVMEIISEIFGDTLKNSDFSKPALFYSMALAIYHELYGMKEIVLPQHDINSSNMHKLKNTFDKIDNVLSTKPVAEYYQDFVDSVSKATSDIRPRHIRTTFIIKQINEALRDI